MKIKPNFVRLVGAKAALAAGVLVAMTMGQTQAVEIAYEGFGYTAPTGNDINGNPFNGVNYLAIGDAGSEQEVLDRIQDEVTGDWGLADTGTYDGFDDGQGQFSADGLNEVNPNTGVKDVLKGYPARQGGSGSWVPGMGWVKRFAYKESTALVDETATLGYTDSNGKELKTTMGKVQFRADGEWTETWRAFDASAVVDPAYPGGLSIPNTGDESFDDPKTFTGAGTTDIPTLGKHGTVVWLSFLSDTADADSGGNNSIQLYNKRQAKSAAGSPQDRTGGIFFKFDGSDGAVWNANKGDAEGAHEVGDNAALSGSGALAQAGTIFAVMKLDFSATSGSGDTDGWAAVTTWLNPDLGAEPTTGGFSSTGYIPFNAIYINSNAGNGNNSLDELRLGTTWADVAPIAGDDDPGDFDGDGDVDGADFLAWQTGAATPADLTLWENNFGTSAAGASTGAVPEPTSICLLSIAGVMGCLRRRK